MARKQTSNDVNPANVDGNIDKIRDILFGGQMRDYESRLADLEKQMLQRIEKVAGNIEKRLESLTATSKKQIDKLAEQLKEERKARADDGKQGARELKSLDEKIESWYTDLEGRLEEDADKIRNSLAEQSEEMSARIEETFAELSESIDRESKTLTDATVARQELASLLGDLAKRLKKDAR